MMSGLCGGPRNMAVDILLMEMAAAGELDVVLRTYGWDPACVSLGRLQDPSREIDPAALRSAGVDLVRRPTGGRAVWHEHELTYSITAAESHPLVAGSIRDSLARTGALLCSALRSAGFDAALSPAGRSAFHERMPANPCFTSHGLFEVTVGGRKVVGSAQARRRGAFLEHGSIIISNDQPRLAGYMRTASDGQRRDILEALRSSSCGLSELIPGIDPGAVAKALHEAYGDHLGTDPVPLAVADLDPARLSGLEEGLRMEASEWT